MREGNRPRRAKCWITRAKMPISASARSDRQRTVTSGWLCRDRRSAAAGLETDWGEDMAFKLLIGLMDASERIQAPKRRLARNSRPDEGKTSRSHGREFMAPRLARQGRPGKAPNRGSVYALRRIMRKMISSRIAPSTAMTML